MHNTFKFAVVGAVAFVACTEDLGPVTKTWTTALQELNTLVTDFAKSVSKVKDGAATYSDPAPDDKEGLALQDKLHNTIVSLEKGVSDAQGLLTSGGASVNEAISKGKVAGVQSAIEKVSGDVKGAIEKLKAQLDGAQQLLQQRASRQAEQATKAKAAAAAAAAEAPPTVDNTKAGEADYGALDFKPGTDELALDKPATKANLDAMIALMNSCTEISVEVEGHTSKVGDAKKNKEVSAKRAQSVTRYLINTGKVSPSKIKKTYGYGSEKPAMDEPAPGSEAEKAMDPATLASVRDRNERIRLRILKPCPAGK